MDKTIKQFLYIVYIILEDISSTVKHIHTFATPFIAWAMALFDRNVWKKELSYLTYVWFQDTITPNLVPRLFP